MKHPECQTPEKCIIESLGGTKTAMGWTQKYDGNGKPLNQDPNITVMGFECETCGRKWSTRTQHGIKVYNDR